MLPYRPLDMRMMASCSMMFPIRSFVLKRSPQNATDLTPSCFLTVGVLALLVNLFGDNLGEFDLLLAVDALLV